MKERLTQPAPDLLPATRDLLHEAESLVAAPIELRPVPALGNDARAQLHLPRDPSDRYVILYSERYQRHLDHLVAHELGHLRRLQLAPPGQRLVPVSTAETRERASRQLERELHELVRSGTPETLVYSLLPVWVEGLVAQLTNTPADLRIEQQIRAEQPGLGPIQERSLLDQVSALKNVLSLEVARFTPTTIHRDSLIMNYVFVRGVGELYHRQDLLRPFARAVNRRMANELYQLAASGPDGGHPRDRQVIAAWAELLEINHWFGWLEMNRLQQWPGG